MDKNIKKINLRMRRHGRVRVKVSGSESRPRLNVFRSNAGMYLQLIDDKRGRTLAAADSREIKSKGTKTEKALQLGKLLAEKALKNKIEEVVFDRGGYRFHGRVKAAADGAREAGLKF